MSAPTAKDHLSLLKAAFDYGIKQDLIEVNPWTDAVKRFKLPPKQKPKPFTLSEIQKIIQTFKDSPYYSYYTDYVEFFLARAVAPPRRLGCVGSTEHDDCSTLWIGESLSRGKRKATKTNKARTITLTPHLQQILLARRATKFKPDELVFTSKTGAAIDDHNFRNRAWINVLKEAGVEYRKPYNTRHTFISHALEHGMNPVMVAELTGHDVRTLYENYAGCIESRPRLPDFLNPQA